MVEKGVIQLLIKTEVKNPDGKIVFSKERQAHSFTIAFLEFMEAFLKGNVNAIEDVANASQNIPDSPAPRATIMNIAGAGSTVYGIMVGTGTTAVDNLDYGLETIIADGAVATKLSYGNTSVGVVGEVGANVDLTLTRVMVNNSGGTITVQEAGIYVACTEDAGALKYFCIVHDLTGAVAVLDTQTITVTYTFRTTV